MGIRRTEGLAIGVIVLGLAAPTLALAQSDAPGARPPEEAAEPDRTDDPEPVDVLPSDTLARIAGLEPTDAPSTELEHAERRVDRELRADVRTDAVRSGRADGYHHALGRSLARRVRVDGADLLLEHVVESLPATVVDEVTRPVGRTPVERRGTPLPETDDHRSEMDLPPLRGYAEHQNLLSAPSVWRRAVVRIHQDRRGHVVRVTFVHRSGSRIIDRAVLAAARRASAGVPPPRVIGDRAHITSDWAIEVGEVAGATGVVGCTDDGDCSVLGHGVVRARVELLDVSDALLGGDE